MAWLLVPVGGAAVSWYVWRKLRRRKYRIAVLGAQMSGKTTLINSWRGEWIDEPGHTQSPTTYERIKLTSQGLRLQFTKTTDMSGDLDGWGTWANPALESRYVLYLIDARVLSGVMSKPGLNWHRLEDDTRLIGRWLEDGKAEYCFAVVTHIDEDPRLAQLGMDDYREEVTRQIDPLVLRLGGLAKVRIILGSLEPPQSAEGITSRMMGHIIELEKTK
jgi:GTPase SAR1 family protein